jgi:hypothetical protein
MGLKRCFLHKIVYGFRIMINTTIHLYLVLLRRLVMWQSLFPWLPTTRAILGLGRTPQEEGPKLLTSQLMHHVRIAAASST